MEYNNKFKYHNSTFYSKLPLLNKKESNLKKNNIKDNSFKKVLFKFKNINNNNLINNIYLTNNESSLLKNNSQNYINSHNIENIEKKYNSKISNHSVININNNLNKTFLSNNKNIFHKIYLNKNKIPKKIIISKNLEENDINKRNNNKSIDNIKTFEETKSKLDYSNVDINGINKNSNNDISYLININHNKSSINPKIKNIKILKYKSFKKNNKKENKFLLKLKQKNLISTKDIYLYYLKENEKDRSQNNSIYNFSKYLKNHNGKFNYGFDKIYGNNQSFISRINEIKNNNSIVYKKDFNILDYQKTLLKLLKKKVSPKYLENLEASYKLFNERNFGMMVPRGRYIDLAEKLKDFLSKEMFEKVKMMDKNYMIYLEKKEEILNRNNEEYNKKFFYKNLNNTISSFNKKRIMNKSI